MASKNPLEKIKLSVLEENEERADSIFCSDDVSRNEKMSRTSPLITFEKNVDNKRHVNDQIDIRNIQQIENADFCEKRECVIDAKNSIMVENHENVAGDNVCPSFLTSPTV